MTSWDDESPLYIESDRARLAFTFAWVLIGVVLIAMRQRSRGVAWLLGAAGFVGVFLVFAVVVVFSLGS